MRDDLTDTSKLYTDRDIMMAILGVLEHIRALMNQQGMILAQIGGRLSAAPPVFPPLPKVYDPVKDTSIEELEWSARAFAALRNDDIKTVGELCEKTRAEIMRTPNVGTVTLREIEENLAKLNLKLKER